MCLLNWLSWFRYLFLCKLRAMLGISFSYHLSHLLTCGVKMNQAYENMQLCVCVVISSNSSHLLICHKCHVMKSRNDEVLMSITSRLQWSNYVASLYTYANKLYYLVIFLAESSYTISTYIHTCDNTLCYLVNFSFTEPPYTTPTPRPGVCPGDQWLEYGGHCYFFATDPAEGEDSTVKTWEDANDR